MGSFFKFKQDKIKLNFKVWNRKGLNIQKKRKEEKRLTLRRQKKKLKILYGSTQEKMKTEVIK